MAYDKTNEKERIDQRDLMRARRAAERDVKLPAVKNPFRRRRCLNDPRRFLREYFPHIYFNEFTKKQNELIDIVLECAEFGTQRAVAHPRGEGKTKICEGATVFSILKGYTKFVVPIAAIEKFAIRIASNIKKMLKSPLFVEDFPEIGHLFKIIRDEQRVAQSQTVGGKPTGINWTNEYIQFPSFDDSPWSGAIIYPLAITGAIRGLAIEEKRPDFLIFDDPETAESARNEAQADLRMEIINKDAAGLKGPNSKLGMIALVTIQKKFSLAAKITDRTKNQAWGGIRSGLIQTWPDKRAMELWDEYMELRKRLQEAGDLICWEATQFYIARQVEMDSGSVVDNPYRFNSILSKHGNPIEVSALQSCMNFICDKDLDAFMCEYQNDPGTEDDESSTVTPITAKIVESRTNGFAQGEPPFNHEGISMAIDVGKRACHWTKIAWEPQNIGSIIDYGVIEVHHEGAASVKKSVERALMSALLDFRESMLIGDYVPDFTLIDASDGVLKDVIYEFVRSIDEFPRIGASKGVGDGKADKDPQPHQTDNEKGLIIGERWYAREQKNENIWLYHPDASYWKRWVHERFYTYPFDENENRVPDSLTLYLPARVRAHTSFAKHIVAKEWREVFIDGRGLVKKFVQVSLNDHWLDSTYMSCAAGAMAGFVSPTELHLEPIQQQSQNQYPFGGSGQTRKKR